jgi:NodT family efflux transporter outer membrane factor (OMF) lipoprotein
VIHFSRRRKLLAAAVLIAPTLAGCTVGPDFEQPASWYSPVSWFQGRPPKVVAGPAASEEVAEPIDPQWWKLFNDPQLTALEQRIADANLDIRVQTIRLAESRASLGIARADAFPQVNGNANYTREKQSQDGVISLLGGSSSPATGTNGASGTSGGLPNSALNKPFNLFQYGFDASWEIDFWGRVRRNVESADATSRASEESRRDTLLSALAEMARDYVQLRGVQRQIEITQQNLEAAQQSQRLTQERASGGLTTDLDVAQAATLVATTAAQLPGLQTQAAQLINAIALLLGQPPNTMTAELATTKPIPPVPPRVPVGLPSELARRRPDIRRAEAQLHSATATVGVAVADFYPRVTLSGSAAIQAIDGANLAEWAARSYSIGPSITLPIFEGGRLKRTLELRQAQQQEAAITYQRTVLNALHEVDNALTAYDSEQRRRAQLEQAVAQGRRALGLARDRYTQGIADFLSVLDAQRNLLAAQQQLTDSTTTISTNLIQIYKALGGGWEGDFPLDTPPPDKAQRAAL